MIKAFDFFCGAGGLTRGLLDAKIAVLAGVDVDERLRRTYEHNNCPSSFVNADIADVDIVRLREEFGVGGDDVVLYAACTPCQPFSTLNRMKGRDQRKVLLLTFGEIVRRAPPDFVLVENVPGLNTAYGREIYEQFAEILRECGFGEPAAGFLDAQDYGVPQVRKRFILLASRHGSIDLPPRREGSPVGVGEYLCRYPAIGDGEVDPTFLNHAARRLMPQHRRIIQAVPKDGGSRQDVADISVLLRCHQSKPTVHKDVFGRMAWGKPAPTLTGRCTDVYCGRFTHPFQDRGISLREAAALQTFRDNYEFFGTFFHIAGQIGNAVPVELARQLGESVVAAAGITERKGGPHDEASVVQDEVRYRDHQAPRATDVLDAAASDR